MSDGDDPVQIENIIIDNMVNESTERSYNASMIEVKWYTVYGLERDRKIMVVPDAGLEFC